MTSSTNTADVKSADEQVTTQTAVKALVLLLITFILGTLCLQGFNLVFTQVGEDVGTPAQASLITAFPSIVLGIVCFIYGSLGDFVSLKRLVIVGLIMLFVGSVFGFVANFFFPANLWTVIVARVLQTAGEQVAGSVYLVITTKYLKNELKVVFFGLYTAGYQLSASIGVFAAGVLSSIAWQYLFLIPAVTILFLPTLLKSLPGRQGSGDKVDWIGFTIFGLASAFLTLFFSYMAWWMLIVAVALFAVFAVYIAKASDPFVTPVFFKNTRWLAAMSLILVFYFTNYCISPLFNGIGTTVYGMTTAQVSTYVVWAFVCAAIVGTCSGLIIGRIGKQAALIIAACLMIAGFVSAALAVNAGFLALTIAACVFYCGVGLMYSPVVSTVLSTIPQEESGRGVGMNDLLMNVTASIGISIIGGLMGSQALAGSSITGATGAAAGYANLLLIGAGVMTLGLIVFLVFRKKIYAQD